MPPLRSPVGCSGFSNTRGCDVWKGDGGRAITSFAIVKTDAAPSVAQYHSRIPVVLDDSQFDDWMRGTPDHAALMKPYAGEIEAWEVPAEVGNVKNDRPELLESRVAVAPTLPDQGAVACPRSEPDTVGADFVDAVGL